MNDARDEIKSRLSVEDVIGGYLELKRAGRNLKALSPFTAEKTPSFMVSPEKGIWHDFSSNKGGDIFTFVMEVEGMTFREALENLANKAGVDLSMYQTSSNQSLAKRKKHLLEILAIAEKYFQLTLTKNRHALEYIFYTRNINRATAEEFRIGYAPDSGRALVDFLLSKKFTQKDLADVGLTNRFGGDLFKARVVVPLMDPTGQTIGFTGRALVDEPNSPKYLNTPQTLLYDKSRHVFGLSQAKDTIRKSDHAILVEGNLDVISSHQAAVKNTVATAGTAMTEHHLKSISRFSPNIRLAFDGDSAGLKATERAIEIAQKISIDLSIIHDLDDAKDPDELIRRDPVLWQQAVTNFQPAIDWVLAQYESKLDLHSAPGKREFSTIALKLINQITDPVERDHYIQLVSEKLNSSLDALNLKSAKSAKNQPTPRKKPIKTQPKNLTPSEAMLATQDTILALALTEPSLRPKLKAFDSADIPASDQIRQKILSHLLDASTPPLDKLSHDPYTYAEVLLLRAEARYAGWPIEDLAKELDTLLLNYKTQKLQNQKTHLSDQLRDAETLGDHDLASDLLTQITNLNKEIKKQNDKR
ncbi:DNA primase [Candidatus Saccharibacteria bacterium]|nr:DNA primase [Candidatus Saccharibacteria bacterium]